MKIETIEAALRRMPSDESFYDEPLAALVTGAGVRLARPVPRKRARVSPLPVLVAFAFVLLIGAGAAIVGLSHGPSAGPDSSAAAGALVGCGGRAPGFSPDVLRGTGTAEKADTAPAAALRALLAGPGSNLPAANWIAASETGDEVLYLDIDPTSFGYVSATVERGAATGGQIGADGWYALSWGSCALMAVAPPGYVVATWSLDQTVTPEPITTGLHILVQEMSCAGGQSAEGRIMAQVLYGVSTVTVTVYTQERTGPNTCQGNPATPYVVHLSESLGPRSLLDGGPYPAAARVVAGRAVESQTPGLVVDGTPAIVPSAGCSVAPALPEHVCGYSTPTPTPAAAPTYIIYTVRSGDTLASIAARFNVPIAQLVAANPSLTTDPNFIVVGQLLNIPPPDQPASPSPTA